MIDRKCSSYVVSVAAAIVRDRNDFFICAVMRATGITTTNAFVVCCPGGGMVIPVGRTQSSSTGVGSAVSQSSLSICRGVPSSSETILSKS